MENQDYSQLNGGKPLQSSPSTPAVGSNDYWAQPDPTNVCWDMDEVSQINEQESMTSENRSDSEFDVVYDAPVSRDVPFAPIEESINEIVVEQEKPAVSTVAESAPVPPPFSPAPSAVTAADVEGIYEAVNSVFEKVEKFQDIIKIQNKTIDRFSKGIVLESRKPLLMELCDLYETVMFGIEEDDKAVTDRFTSPEERCRILRAKLDELLEVIKCTLEDNQVEIKSHPAGTDQLEPYQTVTGREMTDDISRFADFDYDTNVIYVTDRTGFVVKSTEVSNSGTTKVVDHILRPEEVTKIVLNKNI